MNDELSPRLALMPRPSLLRRGRPARQAGPTSAPAPRRGRRRVVARNHAPLDLAETLRIFGQTAAPPKTVCVPRNGTAHCSIGSVPAGRRLAATRMPTRIYAAPPAPCRWTDDWPLSERRRDSTLLNRRGIRRDAVERVTTPATQCAVEADDAQLSFSGDWITVNGLDVKNGDTGIHISGYNDNNNDEVIENCRVTNCSNEGIVAGGSNVQITGNYVDAIGGEVVDKQDGNGPNRDNLEHDLYLTGGGNLVEGNFFGRALSGSCAQLLCYDTTATTVFSNNVCYGGQTAGATLEGGKIICTGNVLIAPQLYWRGQEIAQQPANNAGGAPTGLRLFLPQPNVVVSGNYIEGACSGLTILGQRDIHRWHNPARRGHHP